ncbi:unnamed protein product [Sphagnum balticum]
MQVNFSKNLAQIIREIKYLDAMGFHLPEFALRVTLQEDKYDLDAESLENMLKVQSNSTNIEKAIETIAKTKLTPIQPLTEEVNVLNLLV